MRGRTRALAGAIVVIALAVGGQASGAILYGSDALSGVVNHVIGQCPGTSGIVYTGGTTVFINDPLALEVPEDGDLAMHGHDGAPGTQHIAPMARQMAYGCSPSSRQLLLGLDSVSILVANSAHNSPDNCSDDLAGTPLTLVNVPSQFIPCTSNTACAAFSTTCDTGRQFCLPGGSLSPCTAAQGCVPDGTYTFDAGTPTDGSDDWKDVLAQIYGGRNHTGADLLIHDPNEQNADGTAICFTGFNNHPRNCKRNPVRIDCANPVRGVLLASYGSIIQNPTCTLGGPIVTCTDTSQCPLGQTCDLNNQQCVPLACGRIKHAFRLDDRSHATATFAALVGLSSDAVMAPGIAPYTTLRSTVGGANAPEIADFAAVANPFCNAGTAAMNRGFSDYLDLDPYRRACSVGPAPDRTALEEVCQVGTIATNSDASCYFTGVTPATYPQRERSAPQGRGLLPGGSVDTVNALSSDYLNNATKPRCLGVVLPVTMPQVGFPGRYPAGGNCTVGFKNPSVNPLPGRSMICPDGKVKNPGGVCGWTQNTANHSFDCVVDSTGGGGTTADPRVFNLTPVPGSNANFSTYVDDYENPNFPGVAGLHRFVRRYYGIHMVRPDNSQKQATVSTPCTEIDGPHQIGCLVKASPCSIGFATQDIADASAPFNNLALRVNFVQPTLASIKNVAANLDPSYPMTRLFWLNSYQDPQIGFAQPSLTDEEMALANCMGINPLNYSFMDSEMTTFGFISLPPNINRLGLCPFTF